MNRALIGCFFWALAFAGCDTTSSSRCGPSTCQTCCSANGECVGNATNSQCGSLGNACATCTGTQECLFGSCSSRPVGTGGGGGSATGGGGGGSATGGGGGGSATGGGGGGSATGGGGTSPCGGACQAPTPICNQVTGLCVECASGADCTGPGAVCTPAATCDCSGGSRLCQRSCAACPTTGATTFACSGATCTATACASGFHLCSGICRPDDDAQACGASCTACPSVQQPYAAVCEAGVCGAGCAPGTSPCKGVCTPTGTCSWNATTLLDAGAGSVVALGASGTNPVGVLMYAENGINNILSAMSPMWSLRAAFFNGVGAPTRAGPSAPLVSGCVQRADVTGLATSSRITTPQGFNYSCVDSYDSNDLNGEFDFVHVGVSQFVHTVGPTPAGANPFRTHFADFGREMQVTTFIGDRFQGADRYSVLWARNDATGTTQTVAVLASPTDDYRVWLVSTPAQERVAWFLNGSLVLASRSGPSTWTTAPAPGTLPSGAGGFAAKTIVRADSTGTLALVFVDAGRLLLSRQAGGAWQTSIDLGPEPSAFSARFDVLDRLVVVTSASGGTTLHVVVGNRALSEVLSPREFWAVDVATVNFTFQPFMAVAGAADDVVLFR